jgi:mono/diheme cytochrome c family protein
VNAVTGPDGALYVVDMARGVIQHKVFLTYYLAANIAERKLEAPINLGRIYRIVPDNWKPRKATPFPSSVPELVAKLESANGWDRDTAQRLLVESRSLDALPELARLVKSGKSAQTRLQALWTIEGLHKLSPELLKAAATDLNPKIRMAAAQLATEASWQEGYTSGPAAKGAPGVSQAWLDACAPIVLGLSKDKASEVQIATAFQLPLIGTSEAESAAMSLLKRTANKMVAQGFVVGFAGREQELFSKLAALPPTEDRWLLGSDVLKILAAVIASDRKPQSLEFLFGEVAKMSDGNARQFAVLDAVAGKPPTKSRGKSASIKPVLLSREPEVLTALDNNKDKAAKVLSERLSKMLAWPGKKDAPLVKVVAPLNKTQKELFEKGRTVYSTICIACHQPNGNGLAGLAPSLVGSEWVNGPEDQPIRIVLQGLTGAIDVGGQKWQLEMPGLPHFSDQEVAAVLTYIRREWENDGEAVTPEQVADVRTKIQGRNRPWTAEELQSAPR